MARFSSETQRALIAAGWTPDRRVGIQHWVSALAAEGFRIHAAAERFLSEFGGLAVDVKGSGLTVSREPFSFYPTSCSGEEDRISEWGDDLGKSFYPVGELGQRSFFLVIDEQGDIYLMMDRVGVLGNGDRAIESLARGIAAEWVAE